MAENQWVLGGEIAGPTKLRQKKIAHLAIFLSRSHWMHSALVAAAFVLLWGKPVGKKVGNVVSAAQKSTEFRQTKTEGERVLGSFFSDIKTEVLKSEPIFWYFPVVNSSQPPLTYTPKK